MRGVAVVFGLIAVVLAGMALLYALSLPVVVQAAATEMVGGLKRALLKTGTEIVVYPSFFAVAGVMLWRTVTKEVGEEQKGSRAEGEVDEGPTDSETSAMQPNEPKV